MSPPAHVIRPYRADDLAAVVDVWYRSWSAAFPDLQHPLPCDQWELRFAEAIVPQYAIWIAGCAGRVAGFLAINTDGGYLDQIFIDPDDQGRGIGGTLMEKAKTLCPAGLHLHALQQNAAALRFYERHGFCAGETGVNPNNNQPTVAFVWTPP